MTFWKSKPPPGTPINKLHPLARVLVGCWLMNEGGGDTVYDASGYNNHGTLTNMAFPPTPTSGWNPGKDGPALAFDGVNGWVKFDNTSVLNLTHVGTLVLQSFPRASTNGNVYISKGNIYSDRNAYGTYIYNNLFYFEIANATNYNQILLGTIVTNQWVTYAFTWDGSYLVGYKNGVK